MAEERRMTAEEVASDLLTSEHANVVHESVAPEGATGRLR